MLDPDDPRPPYRQVANHLRAAILIGEFEPGDQLPTGGQLSEMYGVARMTIQKAIQILRKEDLIVSRQGSGVFVKGRATTATGLRSAVDSGFEASEVTIDFFGNNTESLRSALADPLEKVRRGRYTPDLVRVRAVVPNTAVAWTLPCRAADRTDLPLLRKQIRSKIDRHLLTIVDAVHDLEELGLVPSAAAEVRTIAPLQLIELYLINERELFLGLSPVGERTLDVDGAEQRVIDIHAEDTALLHRRRADEDSSSQELGDGSYATEAVAWFDGIWDTVAEPLD